MSFKSLVNKLVKEGKSREAATKIAGKVANAKMKGAGSGPTAKQKARMKKGSPNKMKDLSGDGKITKKDVLIGRGVIKKDDSPAKMDHGKKSPVKMKKQGYNARLDDSLGAKHGKKSQSLKSRRDESEGMEKSMGKRKFSGNKSSAQGSPAKGIIIDPKVKESTRSRRKEGKKSVSVDVKKTESMRGRKNKTKTKVVTNRKGETTKIVKKKSSGPSGRSKSKTVTKTKPQEVRATAPKPRKEFRPSPVKMNGKTLKKTTAKAKDAKGVKTVQPKRSKTLVKNIEKKIVTKKGVKTGSLDASKAKRSKANAAAARKQGYMMNYNTGQYQATPNKRGAERRKESGLNRFQAYDQMDTRNAAQTAGSPMGMYGKHSPANMSGQSYDAKEAYNKNLSASARLHYLENNRADAKAKKGGHAIHKHMGGRR